MTSFWKEALIFGLCLIIAVGVHSYLQSRDAMTTAKTTEQVVAEQLKPILEQIQHDRETVKTPQQIVQTLPQYIKVPQPIFMQGPSTVATSSNDHLPDAPRAVKIDSPSQAKAGDLVIPSESASAFWQHELDCKADGVKLSGCTTTLEAYKKAAKGGGFFSRLRSNSKFLFIGGAVAGAAICGTGHCK